LAGYLQQLIRFPCGSLGRLGANLAEPALFDEMRCAPTLLYQGP
jgi:hypothetical protein